MPSLWSDFDIGIVSDDISLLKLYDKYLKENRSYKLTVGSTQDRNSQADLSLSQSDWILAKSSLIPFWV